MGLLETEITELRKLLLDVRGGKITPEKANTEIGIYNQIHVRAKMMLQAFALSAKLGHTDKAAVESSNLIGGKIKTDNDSVFCSKQNKDISLKACLDYSSETENNEWCGGCYFFGLSRNVILGAKTP